MSRGSGRVLAAVEWSSTHARTAIPGQSETSGILTGLGSVRACLSRRNTFVRGIRIPNVSGAEAGKILRMQLPHAFPISAQELVFAYRLTNDVNAEGRLAIVSAARAESVRNLQNALRESGTKAEEVAASAFGSMLLAKSKGLKDTAVVEKSPEGWSIDLVVDGELRYSRVVPLETDLHALESEVCRTFGMAGLPCGAILAAGSANLSFASAATSQSTLEFMATADAGALGIGLELPEIVESREKRLVGNRARLSVLLWVSAVVLGLFLASERLDAAAKVQPVSAKLDMNSRILKSARDAAESKVTSLSKPSQALERAFQPAQKASDILTLIGSIAPKGVWLTGIVYEKGKPTQIRGTAVNSAEVAGFLDALGAQDRFRDVKLVFSNDATIENTKVSQFSISIHVVGNLPYFDTKPKTKAVQK